MSDTLKPCAHCGSPALEPEPVTEEGLEGWFEIICENEDCFAVNSGIDKADAIERWNRRPDDWQPIETAKKDGSTIELRAVMRVHHISETQSWRPDTPQTQWRLTGWREVPPPSDEQAAALPTLQQEGES